MKRTTLSRLCYCHKETAIILANLFENGVKELTFNDKKITTDSERYKNFKANGYTCVECGLTAEYGAIETNGSETTFHLNLYGINENNEEVMLTKDHIFPKSKGGVDCITNYQVMCEHCNEKKSNIVDMSLQDALAAGYATEEEIYKLVRKANNVSKKQKNQNKQITQLQQSNSTLKKTNQHLKNIIKNINKKEKKKEMAI